MVYKIFNMRPAMKRMREDEGMTLQQIADELGLHRSSVRRNLIEMGISTRNPKWHKEEDDENNLTITIT